MEDKQSNIKINKPFQKVILNLHNSKKSIGEIAFISGIPFHTVRKFIEKSLQKKDENGRNPKKKKIEENETLNILKEALSK